VEVHRIGLIMALLLALPGCVTYDRATFYQPSGPGKTTLASGVPRLEVLRYGQGVTALVRADADKNVTSVLLVVTIDYERAARFLAPVVGFACGAGPMRNVAVPAGQESRIGNGIGYYRERGMDEELTGATYQGQVPKHGDVSVGIYRFQVDVPMCPQSSFLLRLPRMQTDGNATGPATVVFIRKTGRHLDLIPVQ